MSELQDRYYPERLDGIDLDYLRYEEIRTTPEDYDLMERLLDSPFLDRGNTLPNPFNSIILYLVGLTDQFDHEKGRADISGGAPPDIDLDFASRQRHQAARILMEQWGEDRFAYVGTNGTLKPRGIIQKYFAINEPRTISRPHQKEIKIEPRHTWEKQNAGDSYDKYVRFTRSENKRIRAKWDEYEQAKVEIKAWQDLQNKITEMVPDPVHGKEPTWSEVVAASEAAAKKKEGLKSIPELCPGLHEAAQVLEGVGTTAGVHKTVCP